MKRILFAILLIAALAAYVFAAPAPVAAQYTSDNPGSSRGYLTPTPPAWDDWQPVIPPPPDTKPDTGKPHQPHTCDSTTAAGCPLPFDQPN
jgi:hypothetical protein